MFAAVLAAVSATMFLSSSASVAASVALLLSAAVTLRSSRTFYPLTSCSFAARSLVASLFATTFSSS
tara:strand:+ start:166 stop:366 length:201 start_codon:yes stop_codon:yes gene_type:complete